MSYPDLGCYAECLTCELCETGFPPPGDEPDLFPSYEDLYPDDGSLPDDFWDPPPDPPDDDVDFPSPSIPVGDYDLSPTWDPWGVKLEGEF